MHTNAAVEILINTFLNISIIAEIYFIYKLKEEEDKLKD